jgi:hydrogenase expression/formation protein HypD
MTIKYVEEYRDPGLARSLVERIKRISNTPVRLMEVCGTHTMSIFKSGIRDLLPKTVSLLSGPGCPVCVTAQAEIDAFIALSRKENVIITTFGDLMRVPGTASSLQAEHSLGRDIRMVYSTFDALDMAKKNPDRPVVFLGVGFETTAPTVAASIMAAREMKIGNYFVQCANKIVPPALTFLVEKNKTGIDGFILPGHVSVIIGERAYRGFFEQYRIPCVIAGFEPVDILQAICILVEQIETGAPDLVNGYKRAVTLDGNPKAQKIMAECLESSDATWRGLGPIPSSGLSIKNRYAAFDARKRFAVEIPEVPEPVGCACGEVLVGNKTPLECGLYKKTCTPMTPVGPCMVSSEGTCAAYYRFHGAWDRKKI